MHTPRKDHKQEEDEEDEKDKDDDDEEEKIQQSLDRVQVFWQAEYMPN